MRELLQSLLTLSVFVFTVGSMLSLGFGHSLREILRPLREGQAVVRAVVANFVLVPILAAVIARVLPLDPGLQVGLLLVGCAAGAPFLIKLTQAAKGELPLSATLLVLLVPVTVVFVPIVVPWLSPESDVQAGPIARQLAMTLLVPFAIGLVVRAKAPSWAQRLRPIMSKTSTIALIVLFVCTVALNLGEIMRVGFIAIAAALLLILGAFAIGFLLARPGRGRRTVLGLGTAQRNIAAAMLVASQNVPDRDALVMVVLASVVGMVVLFPIAHWLRGRTTRGAAPPANFAVRSDGSARA
jgi:BASS family bile acid:Na+ symporter